MLQQEQINKLTKLKELLDAGILSEDEFAEEKAKILSNSLQEPQPQPQSAIKESPQKPVMMPRSTESVVEGPAYIDLSSGIVLPLGIFAIMASLISAIFTGLAGNTSYFDSSDTYTYSLVSSICDFLASAAELILWICAFNKLSTIPEGNRLGRIPLWTFLYLGILLLNCVVFIADPMAESPLFLIILLAALAFGYIAFISMYKAYTGKMRTYSLVWMIGMGLGIVLALVGGDIISTIIEVGTYVFLMIALLEKKEARL